MTIPDNKDSTGIKTRVAMYNMIPNLFWSVLNLAPISVFCYRFMNAKLFTIFLTLSILTILLPKSFFNSIQLGKTVVIYKKLGVNFINKFTQNGDIINGIIRKKFPRYSVIADRRHSINKLLKQTYIFEKFHFTMFLFFTLTTVYALTKHYGMWAFILSLTNLIYNIYPNFLQQYIRIRMISAGKK